jgi:hypothetical protein
MFSHATAMERSWPSLVSVLVVAGFFVSGCASPPSRPQQTFNEDVAAALLRLAERDQEARGALLANPRSANAGAKVRRVDRENTAELRAIVTQFGWPGRSLVGQRGASAAWILVQHADQDRPFQKQCLKLMEAAPEGEVSKQDVAFLTDRVLLADGKKQRYGTQFKQTARGFMPEPLEDEAGVDTRRAKMGLAPIAEYAQELAEFYGNPATSK